jgi:hypothetical protein
MQVTVNLELTVTFSIPDSQISFSDKPSLFKRLFKFRLNKTATKLPHHVDALNSPFPYNRGKIAIKKVFFDKE